MNEHLLFFLSKQSQGCKDINKTEHHKVFIGERRENITAHVVSVGPVLFSFYLCMRLLKAQLITSLEQLKRSNINHADSIFL